MTSEAAAAQDRTWGSYVTELQDRGGAPFDEIWARFQEIFQDRDPADGPPLVWQPTAEIIEKANLTRLLESLGLGSYEELHRWSVELRDRFWARVIEELGVVFQRPPGSILDLAAGPEHPRWLPGARLSAVESCFKAREDKPAVVFGREDKDEVSVTTYGELHCLAAQVAHGLDREGFPFGCGIALYMPMNLEAVAAYLGIVASGRFVVSIADSFSPTEVRRRLEIAGAQGIVTVDHFLRGGKEIELYRRILGVNPPRAVVIPRKQEKSLDLRPGDLLWSWLLGSENVRFSPCAGTPDDILTVLFSSGTTGDPKAIPWTHLTPLKCAMDGRFHQDIHSDDVVAWPTNMGWMMGPWLVFATLMNGATMALFEGVPTGKPFLRFVRDAGVTILGVVPALVKAWRSQDGDRPAFESVRILSSTGEASNTEDYLWLMAQTLFRAPVIEYCGGTEIGGGYLTGSVLQPASPAIFTTAALGLEVTVLDEDHEEVGGGQEGELFLVPPSIGLSQKLLNRDHHQEYFAGCPPGPGGEILRRHGDQVAVLPGGLFKAQGRADDTMNLSGIKVSSIELERVVGKHPQVFESAAVAIRAGGEGADSLVLFVVPEGTPDEAILEAELQSLIARELNPLFRIHDLVLTDKLPRTASNKIMRRQLRANLEGGDAPSPGREPG